MAYFDLYDETIAIEIGLSIITERLGIVDGERFIISNDGTTFNYIGALVLFDDYEFVNDYDCLVEIGLIISIDNQDNDFEGVLDLDRKYKDTDCPHLSWMMDNPDMIDRPAHIISFKSSREHKSGYIYLLKNDTDMYKIGFSTNVNKRVYQIAKELEDRSIKQLCRFPADDMITAEKILHMIYSNLRIGQTEWFWLEPEGVNDIKSIVRYQDGLFEFKGKLRTV